MKGDSWPTVLEESFINPLTIIHFTVAHASVASSKLKVELDSYAETCVVGNDCSVIHEIDQLMFTVTIPEIDTEVSTQIMSL